MTPGVHKPGGGTNYWKGRVSRFPRTALDSVDESGIRIWPIEWKDVERSFDEIENALKISFPEASGRVSAVHSCGIHSNEIRVSPFGFIRPDHFKILLRELIGQENFHFWPGVFCHRIIGANEDQQVIEYFREKRRRKLHKLSVDYVFVAAGCLQSTALIQRSFPSESNIYPVGKYLQEHFDGYVGRLVVNKRDRNCLTQMSLNEERKLHGRDFGIGIALNRITSLHYHLEITPLARTYIFDPQINRFNLSGRLIRVLFLLERIFSFPLERATRALHHVLGDKVYSVWLKGEELPNSKSQVSIDQTDPTRVVYNHQTSKETMRLMKQELRRFSSFVNSQNLGRFNFAPHLWIPKFISTGGNWHPMGSLRIHNSQESVVSREFALNWNERIRIIDSSIFPSGAHQNPTSMALCLANIAVRRFLIGKSKMK